MKQNLFLAAVLGAFLPCAAALGIGVGAGLDLNNGVRAQAVITNETGTDERGSPQIAVAIKEFHCAMIITDIKYFNALSINKQQLTSAEAWGSGLPNGYALPPTTDPAGPWSGLVWPYRDQYDYFPDPGDPLGDNVGTFFTAGGSSYGFVDIDAILRGGPTDPGPGAGLDRLQRGITGNGLNGPATFFNLDIFATFGPLDRVVQLTIFAATAVVVQRDLQTGQFSEVTVQVPNFEAFVPLPEPTSSVAAIAALAVLSSRKSRR